MEEKELWMNKLKEKLADYSEPAPASGWEQLEKELMPPVEKKIYPYRKWMMAAAAVILLAVVSSVSLYFLGTPAADEIRHIKTPALASTMRQTTDKAIIIVFFITVFTTFIHIDKITESKSRLSVEPHSQNQEANCFRPRLCR